MQQIKILESPGFDELIKNIDKCGEEFLENGSVVYRNANFSTDQQLTLLKTLGDYLGWHPNSLTKNNPIYKENHERNGLSKEARKTKDQILLSWHMEHTDYKNPIVGATWNMHLFTCDSSLGRTGFVDTTQIYDLMPKDWQIFLSNCVEIIQKDTMVSSKDGEFEYALMEHEIPCVQEHWKSKKPTVRVDLDGPNYYGLRFLDNKDVTDKDIELFSQIKVFIFDQIYKNKEIFQFHEWKQGDIVIVDLFKLAHCVFGGFYPHEREFTGYWAYRDETREPWQKSTGNKWNL